MKAKITELENIICYGKTYAIQSTDSSEKYFECWEDYKKVLQKNHMPFPKDSYGIAQNMGQDNSYDYTIATPQKIQPNDIKDLIILTIPKGKYAIYTYSGLMIVDKIEAFFHDIFEKWIIEDGITLRSNSYFEYYNEEFCTETEHSKFFVYIPII